MVALAKTHSKRRARGTIPEGTLRAIAAWSRWTNEDPDIRRFNLMTQVKVVFLHVAFAGTLVLYLATGGHPVAAVVGVAANGLFVIPFIRVFMHSQAHWTFGNGPIRNFLLDRLVSLLYSVAQSGYRLGHLAHHRYDNDYSPDGWPKDLQSTYVFSRNGKPCDPWLWMAFYLVVYQHVVHFREVLRQRRPAILVAYLGENALIAGFHLGLHALSPSFYWFVYLPALGVAWLVAALALYMMHCVPVDDYQVHPTLNTADPFFNWFGDNDGYHLEHSLFAQLHPRYLEQANRLVGPPSSQTLHHNYVIGGLPVLVGRPPGTIVER